ncbi:MAG: ABC transporter permease subunit [Micromonosporaceae bacterium]|nr:ABC transporter permease subunit [Micromonosporaceae bacterium]
MLRVVVRRLLQMVLTLFALSVLMFAWLRNLPGGPAIAMLGERATPERVAALNHVFGYDQPVWVQYGRWLGRMLTGDFGTSTSSKMAVARELSQAFPGTIELSFFALAFAVALGVPLGYIAARYQGRPLDSGVIIGTLVGVSVPVFFLGYLLKAGVAVRLGWLPPSGRQSAALDATHVTNFFVLDGLLTREWDAAADAFMHLLLPALALGTIPLAVIVRITRASVLDVLNEDYVRTAEAKGLRRQTIRTRHVLRNALLPVVTAIGLQIGLLLAGAVLTETVFVFRGVGWLLADGIQERDYARLQAIILLAAVVYVFVNLIVDLSYALIDPRVRVK